MEILIGRGSCEIKFDENDEKYKNKVLTINGEGDLINTFCVYKPIKMYWINASPTSPNKYVGTTMSNAEADEVFAFVAEKAKEMGYSLLLW